MRALDRQLSTPGGQVPRVCIFAPDFGDGGVERMLVNIARGLSSLGIRVDFVCGNTGAPYIGQLPAEVRLSELNSRSATRRFAWLSEYVKSHGPDIVLTAKTAADEVALRVKRHLRPATRFFLRPGTIMSARLRARRANPLKRWLTYRMLRRLYRNADGIIAVSEGVAQDIARITGVDRGLIQVVRNPNITPEMAALAAAATEHPWLADGHVPVVIGMGGLRRAKDFSTLIRAFAQIRQSLDCRLLIFGKGRQRQRLEQLARDLGVGADVQLPGFTENPYAVLAKAQLFVLSSRWEGSPNVLTEALALGVPVVATDCPNGPREITQDGKFGPLVPPGDAEQLARAMLRVLRDPPDPRFLQMATVEYTLEKSAQRYLRAFGLEPPQRIVERPDPH